MDISHIPYLNHKYQKSITSYIKVYPTEINFHEKELFIFISNSILYIQRILPLLMWNVVYSIFEFFSSENFRHIKNQFKIICAIQKGAISRIKINLYTKKKAPYDNNNKHNLVMLPFFGILYYTNMYSIIDCICNLPTIYINIYLFWCIDW